MKKKIRIVRGAIGEAVSAVSVFNLSSLIGATVARE